MGWESIVAMILKFLPTLISWIVELIKGVKGKPALAAHFAGADSDHGKAILDTMITSLQAERAKLEVASIA